LIRDRLKSIFVAYSLVGHLPSMSFDLHAERTWRQYQWPCNVARQARAGVVVGRQICQIVITPWWVSDGGTFHFLSKNRSNLSLFLHARGWTSPNFAN
jgi:hypothetical protein